MSSRLYKMFLNLSNNKAFLDSVTRLKENLVTAAKSPIGISAISAATGSTITYLHGRSTLIEDYNAAVKTISTQTELLHKLTDANRQEIAKNNELRDELRIQLREYVSVQRSSDQCERTIVAYKTAYRNNLKVLQIPRLEENQSSPTDDSVEESPTNSRKPTN